MITLPCDQVGMASRTEEDPEGGELAQLMQSVGTGAENGAVVRYEKGDKVMRCRLFMIPNLHA
jgi:hypothetical protein